ncbi:MAG TPA: 50S ribosomal protein L2 [archaeon]|nr:50S ribosomal protein L2 [archaeon]
MGKRIISRARGKGGPRYRAPSHRFVAKAAYPPRGDYEVMDIVHDPAHNSPLLRLRAGGRNFFMLAAEGVKVGDKINVGELVAVGNALPLSKVPKGAYIFGIEDHPSSGPKFCRSPGTKSIVISHEADRVIVQMPSKQFKNFKPNCLATYGVPAGSGRGDKPYYKAGQVYFAKMARNRLWPRSSANKMNPVDHPFGGRTKPGTPKSISRWAPPGAKVGSIASKRTGRRKK